MIENLKRLNYSKKKSFSISRSIINFASNVRLKIVGGLNSYIINPLKLNSKNFGGPKDTLSTFSAINKYVEDKRQQGLSYFSWQFFKDRIEIKQPVYTIGNPLPGAEVVPYIADTTENVYLMPNVRVYSKHFFSLTEDSYLLGPVSNYYSDEKNSHPAFGTLIFPTCKKLKGISIIVRGGAYWHKMQDGLPALYLAELAGFSFDKIDHFIIQDNTINKDSIFTRAGIPLEKQVRLFDESECYDCEQLIFSSWYDRKGDWYKDYLMRIIQLKPVVRDFPKKIYLSRSRVNTRKVLNEDEVVAFLERYGFKCIHNEDLSTDEQIYLFQNATHIISCHGSQLTNIIFCKPGTKVCEIRHITHKIHYRKAFHDLSNGFGLDYYLLYTAIGENYIDEKNNIVETDTHMYIDLVDMRLMLDKMNLKEIN